MGRSECKKNGLLQPSCANTSPDDTYHVCQLERCNKSLQNQFFFAKSFGITPEPIQCVADVTNYLKRNKLSKCTTAAIILSEQ